MTTTNKPQYPGLNCPTCYATTELLNHPETHNPDATPETFYTLTETVATMTLLCGHTITENTDGYWKVKTS